MSGSRLDHPASGRLSMTRWPIVPRVSPLDCYPKDELTRSCEAYISSRRLLLSLADAGGRLMYARKDLLELAGLTTRLYTLLSTLHTLEPVPTPADKDDVVALSHVDVGVPANSVTGVPLVLVRNLSLTLKPGEHLMITGSNGVGKTAVARVIAGLWAAQGGGEVTRPKGKKGVFVVPQRSYMVAGSLLDQYVAASISCLWSVAHRCHQDHLSGLVPRVRPVGTHPRGADGDSHRCQFGLLTQQRGRLEHAQRVERCPERRRKAARECLSPLTEWKYLKRTAQMGLARVFYHRPKFAVLDGEHLLRLNLPQDFTDGRIECTSAVSSDVEGRMYQHAKSLGITLITISLRLVFSCYRRSITGSYHSSSTARHS